MSPGANLADAQSQHPDNLELIDSQPPDDEPVIITPIRTPLHRVEYPDCLRVVVKVRCKDAYRIGVCQSVSFHFLPGGLIAHAVTSSLGDGVPSASICQLLAKALGHAR